MKSLTSKTRVIFMVLLFALAFAVPVSNTVTEAVGITQTVNAKKKSKKIKKQGRVITVKKADNKTARQIYNLAMKDKTFTLQYKCKSTSKKNIKAGKKKLTKLCNQLDKKFMYFNVWAVDGGVSSLLDRSAGKIQQSGRYVYCVVTTKGKLIDHKYSLDLVSEAAKAYATKYEKNIEAWRGEVDLTTNKYKLENAKTFVHDYEAGTLNIPKYRFVVDDKAKELYNLYVQKYPQYALDKDGVCIWETVDGVYAPKMRVIPEDEVYSYVRYEVWYSGEPHVAEVDFHEADEELTAKVKAMTPNYPYGVEYSVFMGEVTRIDNTIETEKDRADEMYVKAKEYIDEVSQSEKSLAHNIVQAINNNQFYRLDDVIRLNIVYMYFTDGVAPYGSRASDRPRLVYDYDKFKKDISGGHTYHEYSQSVHLANLHNKRKTVGVCDELDKAWAAILNMMYYKNNNSKEKFITSYEGYGKKANGEPIGHQWLTRVFKTKFGLEKTFVGENGKGSISYLSGYNFDLSREYPDPTDIFNQ